MSSLNRDCTYPWSKCNSDKSHAKECPVSQDRKKKIVKLLKKAKPVKREPHRIPYNTWANSQLSIAKYYGGCNLNGKFYALDYKNARKEGDKFFPDLVEVVEKSKKRRKLG